MKNKTIDSKFVPDWKLIRIDSTKEIKSETAYFPNTKGYEPKQEKENKNYLEFQYF